MWRTERELERICAAQFSKKQSGLASAPREAFAEAVIRSVELIVQADAHDVAGVRGWFWFTPKRTILSSFRNKDNHKGHGGHYGETGEDGDQFLRDRDRHLCQAVALRLPLPR